MQVLDDQKRSKIIDVAAELFAAQPFHKVLLSDVAEGAGVGKGTLYIYFANKEELYLSVLYSGFTQLVEGIQDRLRQNTVGPLENLKTAIAEIVYFAYRNPHMFELMRTVPRHNTITKAQWTSKRSELKSLLSSIIQRGIEVDVFRDPHPDLTARFIPGMVRSALMEDTREIDPEIVTAHIVGFTLAALMNKGAAMQKAS